MPETQPEWVDINTITVLQPPRPLAPPAAELTESVRAEGMVMPLVLDRQFDLVSGGRRLAVARGLGLEKVMVVRAKHLVEACELVVGERRHGVAATPMTFDQQWALIERLRLLKVPGGGPTSTALARAVGHSSSWMEACRRLFKAVEANDPDSVFAEDLLNRVRSGGITAYTGARLLRDHKEGRAGAAAERLQTPAHQYHTLERIVGQLAGIAAVMERINPVTIDSDQAAWLAAQMAGPNTSLTRLIRRLKDRSQ